MRLLCVEIEKKLPYKRLVYHIAFKDRYLAD